MFSQNPVLGPGTDTFSNHLFEILIMLAIAAILGYLLGQLIARTKWKSIVDGLEAELASARKTISDHELTIRQNTSRIHALEEDLKECGNQKVFLQEDITIWRNKFEDSNTKFNQLSVDFTALESAAKSEKSKNVSLSSEDITVAETQTTELKDASSKIVQETTSEIKSDDFERIEGIGPVINKLLHEKGIHTFEQLGSTDLSKIEDILSTLEGGHMHQPDSWMKQARLAAENNFEALDDYQHYLVGGKDPKTNESLALAHSVFGKKIRHNDLVIIEGIGPKIGELFNAHGIYTWAKLAGTSVDRCREILEYGGPNYTMHKPDTWPNQAAMAASGQWEELKAYQDALEGGREG